MWAFEPLAELPVGAIMAVPKSALAKFINGNDISVTFTAGLRFWFLWDWFSLDIHVSKPLYPSDKKLVVAGSDVEYQASSVRRVTPGLGVGLFGDVLWVAVDYDQLRHRSVSGGQLDPFRPNDVITGAVVFTVALAPVTAFRNGLGAIRENRKEKEAAAEEKKKQEAEKNKNAEASERSADGVDPETAGTTEASEKDAGADDPGGENPEDSEIDEASAADEPGDGDG
jgi:hypothetical protein